MLSNNRHIPVQERLRQREEEERKKDRQSLLIKSAAAVGIGYVAYKNYGTINKITNTLRSKASISLNRAATNNKFIGAIGQVANLNDALDEIIDYSPSGLLRTIKKEGNTERLGELVAAKNAIKRNWMNPGFVEDLEKSKKILSNDYTSLAHTETGRLLLKQMFDNNEDIVKNLGKDKDTMYNLLNSNSSKLFGPKGMTAGDDFDTNFYNFLEDYVNNPNKTINLADENGKLRKDFFADAMAIVKNINEKKLTQSIEYKKTASYLLDFENNDFARISETIKMGRFSSLVDKHSNTSDAFLEAMLENGQKAITMKEARDNYVKEINGKLFMTTESEGATRLQDYFGNKLNKNDFAEKYISQGVTYGLKKDKLESHLFSSNLFVDELTGEITNTTITKNIKNATIDYFEEQFEIPFLHFNPISFLPGRKTATVQKDLFTVLEGGKDIQSLVKSLEQESFEDEIRNIDARARKLAKSYMYDNGKVIDMDISSTINGKNSSERFEQYQQHKKLFSIDGEFSLDNARSGKTSNYAQAVSGRTNRNDLNDRNKFKKFFGLGGQEVDSNIENLKSWIESVRNPMHTKDAIDEIKLKAIIGSKKETINSIDNLRNMLFADTKNLDRDGQIAFYEKLNEALKISNYDIDLNKIHDDDYAAQALKLIASRNHKITTDSKDMNLQIRRNLNYKAKQFSRNIDENYTEFKKGKRFLHDRRLFKSDSFFNQDEKAKNVVNQMDDVRMLIEQFAFNEADIHKINLTSGIYKKAGVRIESAEKQLTRMRSINEITYFSQEFKSKDLERNKWAAEFFNEYYNEDSRALTNLVVSLKDSKPFMSTPFEKGKNVLGDTQYILIADAKNPLKEINKHLIEKANNPQYDKKAIDIAKNMAEDIVNNSKSLFAGPNSENITGLTRDLWFFANRLDTSMQQMGLGLENKKKGSFFSIIANQHMTRFMAPMVALEYMKYIDGLTGDRLSDSIADGYVNMQLDIASIKEATGINSVGRSIQKVFPWLGAIGDTLPFKAFNTMTFGLFSEFRSREDLKKYYESGEDEVRSGRYWGIGSSNPYQGGRISHFEPNWYRKLKSDYMFSDNVYGTEKEYWQNHWLPTPTNLTAPIRHFITDPYHYEEKHKDLRPYVETGGFDIVQQIPLIGPVVDKVVSGVLKPTRLNPKFAQAHKEYVETSNERIISQYLGMNAGGYITIRSGGSISLHSDTYTPSFKQDLYDENGLVSDEALSEDAESFTLERDRYIQAVYNDVTLDDVYMQGGIGASGMASAKIKDKLLSTSRASIKSKEQLRRINTILTDGKTTSYNDNPKQAGQILNPNRILTENDYIDAKEIFSSEGLIKDVTYRATEMGGMYGFLFNTITNTDEKRSSLVLETSDRFNDMADKFWDLNLGGLGGDYSEIFRRYFPRDKNKYYNPIRNSLPDWLPGSNYYIDFQHGDAFSKIANGEMRLPGAAYEKLYNVRKDAYGNYSAFDRYRILADIAPYSEEYRMAKKEVALLNSNGYLDEEQKEEYAEIRKQVTAKNKKHDFHEDRFNDIDVDYEYVTIDKIIDGDTFTTKEYQDNPIRMAGISVKKGSEAEKTIASILTPGTKVKVALDRNPQTRIRKDSMNTMRAVVYSPTSINENPLDFKLGNNVAKGYNLNLWLSHQEGVTVNDDKSDVATLALFNDGERMLGRVGNWIRRDVVTNIPVLNVVADVYLPAKSAVESYEDEVYGKNFKDWRRPYTSFIKPSLNAITKNNPIFAAIQGGSLLAMFATKNRWKKFWIGASIGGSAAGVRAIGDTMKGTGYDKWIPANREKEYDINEYFDRLTYIKYKGLYNKAVEMAKEKENVDLERIFRIQERNDNKGLQEYLLERKRLLTIRKKTMGDKKAYKTEEELEKVKFKLESLADEELLAEVGPYTALALRYRNTYLSTLHAAGTGETFDYNQIYRSLPAKDRPYFTEFIKAKPKDRRKILELIPRNQRPIYQRYFGMEMDEVESNEEYFSRHRLPNRNWEGWEAGESLDNVKIKVMKNEGLDITEANYWPEDEAIAEAYGTNDIPDIFNSDKINKGELEKILRGAGLEDVKISILNTAADTPSFTTNINIVQDRSEEITQGLTNYMQYNI